MSLLDFTLAGSDPNQPNAFVATPDQVIRWRAMADALSKGGSDYSPVQSPWQGAARMGQALAGAIMNYRADQAQRLATADSAADQSNVLNRSGIYNDPGDQPIPSTPGQTTPALAENDRVGDAIQDAQDAGLDPHRAATVAALGGSGASSPPSGNAALATALSNYGGSPSPASSPPGSPNLALAAALGAGTPYGTSNANGGAPASAPSPTALAYRAAITGPGAENTGNNYGAVGPVTRTGDRAYGRYQVMGSNIPAWTQAVLGRTMTPQQFLSDPTAQDAVFDHQFGNYAQQYGAQNAASMWLTGRTLANGGASARDQLGTSGQAYADSFTRNLGAAPASQAITQATGGGGGSPSWADVEADAKQGDAFLAAQEAKNGTGAPSSASAYASGQPSPAASSLSRSVVSPTPAYDPAQVSGVDRLSADAAASTLARPAVPSSATPSPTSADLGQLRSAMTAPTPALGTGASGLPAQASGATPASPFPASQGAHGDVAGLLRIMQNPWSSPAAQQVASTLLQTQLPQRPSIIDGPNDPATGYPTKLVFSPTQGVLGRLNADGTITAAGAASASSSSSSSSAPPVPPGVDPAEWRKTLAQIAAKKANPSAADELDFAQKLIDRPSYKEYAASLPTANALPQLAKENSPAGDTALIDSVAKIVNPGLAVRQGTYAVYEDEQSGLNRFSGEINKLIHQGAVLQPDTRAQLMRIANQKMQQYRSAWQTDADQATKVAKANGLDPSRVVPQLPDLAPLNLTSISSEKTQAYPVEQPQQQPPAPGARKAPDGNWYIPDPARPGKYLMVH